MAEASHRASAPGLPRGLYAITSAGTARLAPAVAAAIRGGAAVIQYRDKGSSRARRLREAIEIAKLCRGTGVVFIVNDDVELARAAGANGVHLGRDDLPLADARARLGRGWLIGVSCYDSLERGLECQADGADYLAFGSFFASPTKPAAARANVDLLREARSRLSLPIVAIGGITPVNGAMLVAAGADCIAAVSGVFGQADVEAAARRYVHLFGARPP
ncbi:MAG: thiamine phosphate synthase [Gammaproteobacteria bacterium]|nr:thiamine phosphate synthase [Gammaproteobacteria bacterium]